MISVTWVTRGMAAHRRHLIFCIFTLQFLFPQGAKILTVSFIGGSHFLYMDEVSRVLQESGHDVTMFHQSEDGTSPSFKQASSVYKVTTSYIGQKLVTQFQEFFAESQKLFFTGRSSIQFYFGLMEMFSEQCQAALNRTDIMEILLQEKYDIAVIDALNPCTFLICKRLGIPYIAVFTTTFINALRVGLPLPLSYVPMHETRFTDHMDFFQRLQNTLMYLGSHVVDKKAVSIFDETIDKYFPKDSRPSLADLHRKAELWIYNVDFALEFARPLLPNIQYVGGLMAKPAKPVSQELQAFIGESGEAGFIVVSLGSMFSAIPLPGLLKEMNDGLAKLPQKVIWRYKRSQWPKDLQLAQNIKLMDWVSQNDLLGHAKIRLLVTHGGINSLSEAIYHGVPVVGIPLFGDQFDNLVRIKAKNMGTFVAPHEIMAESFADTLHHIIENQSYKTSAEKQQAIRRSQPFPPDQQLVRWVEHIIQSGGGGHLRPYSYQQPWYQQFLLDVMLFISVCLTVIIYLITTLFRFLITKLCNLQKQKQS